MKTFVLDTSVLLHDPTSIKQFGENNIIIPIQCIEELDKFKIGNETKNFNAREVIRYLDKVIHDKNFNGGISLGENMGTLKIVLIKNIVKEIHQNLELSNDNKILNTALFLKKECERKNQDNIIILVSKDINLRVKAKSLRIEAQDYKTDNVKDMRSILEEIQTIDVENNIIEDLYSSGKNGINYEIEAFPNQSFILKSGNQSILARYFQHKLIKVNNKDKYVFNIKPKNTEQAFAFDSLLNDDISLVTLEGKAGTGKTLLALASALYGLQQKSYKEILFTRQTISMGNKEIGFLPGDINEKISPFMKGMEDNLAVLKEKEKNSEFIEKNKDNLKIEPLSYIRGRSLNNVFFIIDEAQNLTPHEVKTIITRAGEKTKMVFIGDIKQIDNPFLDEKSNGFSYLIDRFKSEEVHAHVQLIKGERSFLAELAGNIL